MALRLRPRRCPSLRSFSAATVRCAIRPEDPRFIPVPEPPQPDAVETPVVKGKLPLPRNVLAISKGKDKTSEEWLAQVTQTPTKHRRLKPGSRREWRAAMAESRRQDLRSSVVELREKATREMQRRAEESQRNREERERRLNAPEREDDRLTTPSHNIDLETIHQAHTNDPTRADRIAHKELMVAMHANYKRDERLGHLNDLHINARKFIVTPQQLDAAIDEAFGSAEKPVTFGHGRDDDAASVWAYGRPAGVQDMLNQSRQLESNTALGGIAETEKLKQDRLKRIAEVLTGGKL
ncbi:hypothetical protein K470DRAFT_256995 [Piedraia hortae CBS 480.64]|uniref:Uncharacterized protein n=1 Tax=Piedraia hortae CBS 480.64 TaxID=1314780 RepID=A0A6A7C1D7_9PEZI|nr:hypothetical protein K470DRAFT_256995 [Piedraia hortae CBS 480.64]